MPTTIFGLLYLLTFAQNKNLTFFSETKPIGSLYRKKMFNGFLFIVLIGFFLKFGNVLLFL